MFKAIRSFRREIYSIITVNDTFEEQINLKNEIDNFNENTKLKKLNKKEKKLLTHENADKVLRGRSKVLNGFESKIVPRGKQTK